MLIQERPGGLRLIAQSDHAFAAGRMAAAWRGTGGLERPLDFEVVLATSLHDIAWVPMDLAPRFDPTSGRPFDFAGYPTGPKLAAYSAGVDWLGRLRPGLAYIVSQHYAGFAGVRGQEAFLAREARRRARIERSAGFGEAERARLQQGLEYLQLFDGLSLFLCLTPPDVAAAARPEWLLPGDRASLPGGGTLHLRWDGPDSLRVDPFPFEAPVRLELPFRELRGRRWDEPAELSAAWHRAERALWRPTLSPPAG